MITRMISKMKTDLPTRRTRRNWHVILLFAVLGTASGFGCGSSKGDRDPQRNVPVLPPAPAVAFIVDSHDQVMPPNRSSRAWTIKSVGYDPITISEVTFNGERTA